MITGASFRRDGEPVYGTLPQLGHGRAFKGIWNCSVRRWSIRIPGAFGSSDVGNVSLELPTIHEYLAIADTRSSWCITRRFSGISPRGDDVVILAPKGLAFTGWDLLSDEKLREASMDEYRKSLLVQK